MKRLTEKQVYEVLKTVVDPELGVSVVDLGLVYDVVVEKQVTRNKEQEGFGVRVVMTLTSPGCPLMGVIEMMVREAVGSLEGVSEDGVEVRLTFDPLWTVEMMSEEAKAELGFG